MATSKAWAVWLAAGLSGCAHVAPSSAPLSQASAEAALVPEAVTPVSEKKPAESATAPSASARPPSKLGKRALYQRACDLGSALGCNDLAILFGNDVEHAVPLLERSCSLGLTRGCANLGSELLWGEPSRAARTRAIGLLSQACEQADPYGCDELGNALYDAEALGEKGSFGRAHTAYEKACKLGRAMGCLNDGWMLRRGEGTPKDPQRSRQLFRFSCDQQVYAGCAALGYDLLDDAQNPAEYAEGARFAKLACEHDEAFGCFSLGAALAYGTPGDAQKMNEGLALLARSCKLGLSDGCKYAANLEQRLKNAAAAPHAQAGADTAPNEDEDEDEGEDQD